MTFSQETIEALEIINRTLEGVIRRQSEQDQVTTHNAEFAQREILRLVRLNTEQQSQISTLITAFSNIEIRQQIIFETVSEAKEKETWSSPGASVDEREGLSPTEWLKKKDSLLRELSPDQEKKGG